MVRSPEKVVTAGGGDGRLVKRSSNEASASPKRCSRIRSRAEMLWAVSMEVRERERERQQ
ncbi:hypothetical protein IEQ34_021911 [Dendrobium chrysotoxum]|uniref:Uncharacterized protein n=1 Tax=Dendrobium chrysotoxum TaxID=161865 RepID=A0AAV7FVM5_DENCH|nr:hypothetical protein IEQ34_021911 [Dendrobium chrysotoxum]